MKKESDGFSKLRARKAQAQIAIVSPTRTVHPSRHYFFFSFLLNCVTTIWISKTKID
jgi:hypothetical protein